MPLEAQKEKKALAQRMQDLRKDGNFPSPLLDMVEAVYTAQIEAREEANVPPAAEVETAGEQARAQGAPMVDRESLPCDLEQARMLFDRFLALLQDQQPTAEAGGVIAKAIEDGEMDADVLFERFRANDQKYFTEWAAKTPSSPSALVFLVKSALTPSLAAAAQKLDAERNRDNAWIHGHCPVCGGLPLISELRGKEGARFLTCSYCLTDYKAKRLGCPFCGEDEQEKLLYFDAEEEPGSRVDVCTACKMYIKSIDFRNFDRKVLPLLDDLASLSMDVLARQEGYSRPTASGWGF